MAEVLLGARFFLMAGWLDGYDGWMVMMAGWFVEWKLGERIGVKLSLKELTNDRKMGGWNI